MATVSFVGLSGCRDYVEECPSPDFPGDIRAKPLESSPGTAGLAITLDLRGFSFEGYEPEVRVFAVAYDDVWKRPLPEDTPSVLRVDGDVQAVLDGAGDWEHPDGYVYRFAATEAKAYTHEVTYECDGMEVPMLLGAAVEVRTGATTSWSGVGKGCESSFAALACDDASQ